MHVAGLFPMQDAGIYGSGTEVMSCLYRRNISGKHKAYIRHRKSQGITTSTSTSLYSKNRTFGRLTEGIYDIKLLLRQSLTKPEGCYRLAFP